MYAYWEFLRTQAALLGFGFLCVFWGNFGQSFFLGWYGNAIKSDLNISAQHYGAVYSLATMASAAAVVWAGALIDRVPLKTYVILVASGLCAAAVVMANVSNIWLLALGFFGLRLFGQALLPHTGITTMARLYAKDRGKAMSIAGSGVPLGEVLLPVMAVALLSRMAWQQGWWWVAASVPVIFVPLALLCLRRGAPSTPPQAQAKPHSPKPPVRRALLLADRRFWMALPALLATPFVLTAIFIHQGFLLEAKQWPEATMAQAFVVYGIGHWLFSLMFGVLVDRFGGRMLLRVYLAPLIAALFLLANVEGLWVAIAMMVLFAATIGGTSTVINALWAEVYGTEHLGMIRSSMAGIAVFATALSPFISGFAIDHGASIAQLGNGTGLALLLALAMLRWSYR